MADTPAPSDPTPSTEGIVQPEEFEPKGTLLLLELLGTILIFFIVETHKEFTEFLESSYQVGKRWCEVACVAYLFNVFRQVHGLGIALHDHPRLRKQKLGNLNRREKALTLIYSILVLGLSTALIVFAKEVPKDDALCPY